MCAERHNHLPGRLHGLVNKCSDLWKYIGGQVALLKESAEKAFMPWQPIIKFLNTVARNHKVELKTDVDNDYHLLN